MTMQLYLVGTVSRSLVGQNLERAGHWTAHQARREVVEHLPGMGWLGILEYVV